MITHMNKNIMVYVESDFRYVTQLKHYT